MHSSAGGRLACFRALAVVNSAAVRVGLHVSFRASSLDVCPGVGFQGHMVSLFLIFYGTFILFSIVAVPV